MSIKINVSLPLGIEEKQQVLRDRPFNLQGEVMFFFSFINFFSDNTRVRIFFFCRAKGEFFSLQKSTLGYMT